MKNKLIRVMLVLKVSLKYLNYEVVGELQINSGFFIHISHAG